MITHTINLRHLIRLIFLIFHIFLCKTLPVFHMSYVSFSPVDVTISEKMKSRASHFGIPIEELQKRAQDRWSL